MGKEIWGGDPRAEPCSPPNPLGRRRQQQRAAEQPPQLVLPHVEVLTVGSPSDGRNGNDGAARSAEAEYVVYRLELEVAAPATVRNVFSIFGDEQSPLVLPPAHQQGTAHIGGVDALALAESPVYTYDSWLTVGPTDGAGSELAVTPGLSAQLASWSEEVGVLEPDGAVYWLSPAQGPSFEASGGGRGRVAVGQLCLPATVRHWSVSLNVRGGRVDDSSRAWRQSALRFAAPLAAAPTVPDRAPEQPASQDTPPPPLEALNQRVAALEAAVETLQQAGPPAAAAGGGVGGEQLASARAEGGDGGDIGREQTRGCVGQLERFELGVQSFSEALSVANALSLGLSLLVPAAMHCCGTARLWAAAELLHATLMLGLAALVRRRRPAAVPHTQSPESASTAAAPISADYARYMVGR
eukprot:SAG11_NODE_772_length_7254_cov_1.857582_6_plen_412_part_00